MTSINVAASHCTFQEIPLLHQRPPAPDIVTLFLFNLGSGGRPEAGPLLVPPGRAIPHGRRLDLPVLDLPLLDLPVLDLREAHGNLPSNLLLSSPSLPPEQQQFYLACQQELTIVARNQTTLTGHVLPQMGECFRSILPSYSRNSNPEGRRS